MFPLVWLMALVLMNNDFVIYLGQKQEPPRKHNQHSGVLLQYIFVVSLKKKLQFKAKKNISCIEVIPWLSSTWPKPGPNLEWIQGCIWACGLGLNSFSILFCPFLFLLESSISQEKKWWKKWVSNMWVSKNQSNLTLSLWLYY